MLSLILFFIIIIGACLWGAWQMDVTIIEKDMERQHSYVVGLTQREYAERVLWARTEKAFYDRLNTFKNFFTDRLNRFEVKRYWNCIVYGHYDLIPNIRVTYEQFWRYQEDNTIKHVLGFELSFGNRWNSIEFYYKQPKTRIPANNPFLKGVPQPGGFEKGVQQGTDSKDPSNLVRVPMTKENMLWKLDQKGGFLHD